MKHGSLQTNMNRLRWKKADVIRVYKKAFIAFVEALLSNVKKNLDLIV